MNKSQWNAKKLKTWSTRNCFPVCAALEILKKILTEKVLKNFKKFDSAANCNFVQILSKLPKYPEISLKIPKFLLSFLMFPASAQFRPHASYCVSWPLVFAFDSLPKQNFVKYSCIFFSFTVIYTLLM